jgi:hypothetical protein
MAYQIYWELKKEGIYSWIDMAEIKPGDSLLEKIKPAIKAVDYLVVLISSNSVSSDWVKREVQIAMTDEVNTRRLKVIPLKIAECEMSSFLEGRDYIDFRDNFANASDKLIKFLKGISPEPEKPKQAKLAEILNKASEGVWNTYTMGKGAADFSKTEFVNILRGLSEKEVEGAVAIGYNWFNNEYKRWENDLIQRVGRRISVSEYQARRILQSLENKGFISKADDLDYSKPGMEQAYTQENLMWILKRLAQQSEIFDFLPKPKPFTIGQFLIREGTVNIISHDWSAAKFASPTIDNAGKSIFAVVTRYLPPERSWLFSSEQDYYPQIINQSWAGKAPISQLSSESVALQLSMEEFDDLGILK